MVRTIVGANWGDEGKGKVTDLLAEESDVVVTSKAARMRVTPSSMNTANLRCICCRPAFSIKTWSTSSDRAWR